MKTRRSIMLVERSKKTGRIRKAEDYTIKEFLDKIDLRIVGIPSLWERMFQYEKTVDRHNKMFKQGIGITINYLIDKDGFGKKTIKSRLKK